MAKFGRNYKLRLEDRNFQWVDIGPPFSMSFDVFKNVLLSTNFATISITNLPLEIREKVHKDQWNVGENRLIELMVGYGDDLTLIATGNLSRVFSKRDGVNYTTTIISYDYGFAVRESKSNFTASKGTTKQNIILQLVESLRDNGISIGAIDSFPGTVTRGISFSGNSLVQLDEFIRPAGGKAWIDNSQIFVIKENTGIKTDIVINTDTGLLSTPTFEQFYIEFDLLFEPRLRTGQVVRLESLSVPRVNGKHSVNQISHKGNISPVEGGHMVTTVQLYGLITEQDITKGSIA